MPLKRILIVDDQMDIRRLLRESLRVLGGEIDVVDVPSGEEALLVISRQRFDLLISDIRLAGMSGLELVRKVRKRNPGLKVILVTGLSDSEVRRQVSAAGVNAYFFKPVDIASLQAAAKECLANLEVSPRDESQEGAGASIPQVENTNQADPLRVDLGADFVLLADFDGRVRQRSGLLPGDRDEAAILSSAARALQAAGDMAKALHGMPVEKILVVEESGSVLHLIRAGGDLFFVAQVSPDRGSGSEVLEQAVVPLAGSEPSQAFPAEGDEGEQELPDSEPVNEADVSSLDLALQQAEDNRLDLDEFWEVAAGQDQGSYSSSSGAISYEQALRLGLAPEEEGG